MTQDARGDADAAFDNYTRALDLADQTGDLRTAAALRYNLGAILYERGQYEGAHLNLNRSLETAMAVSDYETADAARELLRWLSNSPESDESVWTEDLLLNEFAVDNQNRPVA